MIDHIAIGPGGIFVIDSPVLAATGTDGILATVPEAAISAANQLADAIRQIVPPLTRQYVVPVLAYVASAPMSIARGPVQVCTTSMLQRVIESRTDREDGVLIRARLPHGDVRRFARFLDDEYREGQV